MLARSNRLVSADEYRAALRGGRRIPLTNAVVSVARTAVDDPARFGFIVTRKVGNAVVRNRVRRRLKAISRELVDGGFVGADVVMRALPVSATVDWPILRLEVSSAVKGSALQ